MLCPIAVNTCTHARLVIHQETGGVFAGRVNATPPSGGPPATAPRPPTGASRPAAPPSAPEAPAVAGGSVAATDATATAGSMGTTAPTSPTTAPNTGECGWYGSIDF